jgi:hypothetical protein
MSFRSWRTAWAFCFEGELIFNHRILT